MGFLCVYITYVTPRKLKYSVSEDYSALPPLCHCNDDCSIY